MYNILPKVQSKQEIIFNRYIPRSGKQYILSGTLSTGTDPANNIDLIKMYKEKYIYQKCNGKIEGGLLPKR